MHTATAGTVALHRPLGLIERLNTDWHELALRGFMVIVLAPLGRAPAPGAQIYVLGWPVPEARGALGLFFPWLVKSETLHYGYALVMLVGLWTLRKGFTGKSDHFWWMIAFCDPVLSPHRARPAAGAGAPGSQPVRAAGAHEPRATVGAARRTAPLLQHHRVHPDGDRDVLPPVPACRRGDPAAVLVCHTRRGIPVGRVRPRQRRNTMALAGALLAASLSSGACHRSPRTESQLDVAWTLRPEAPAVGPATLTVTLRQTSGDPVKGARCAARGPHVARRNGASAGGCHRERAGRLRPAVCVHHAGRLGTPRFCGAA